MDVALDILDPLAFDKAYAYFVPAVSNNVTQTGLGATSSESFGSAWPRDKILRQCISLLVITQIGATMLYLVFSAISYFFFFDRRLEYHPRFLKNQIRKEIVTSLVAVPWINLLTLPIFLAEVRGKSYLYTRVDEYGWGWLGLSTLVFMIWNDFLIYWIHRIEHHPSIYKYIHKPHHKWIGMYWYLSLCPDME